MGGKVGIIGYGVYVPMERIQTELIVKEREKKRKDLPEFIEKVKHGLLLRTKSVASLNEDSTTIATEAAENAITMAGVDPQKIEAVAAGSESKPYAVGTIARHVASFVGMGRNVYVADLEGACNAGMQALNFVECQIRAGKIQYGLAIGTDVAQAPIADPLEYACGAGAGAFILGSSDVVATIVDSAAYSSLTMDFWRRDGATVPSHFGRTTVEAYIKHVIGAIEGILRKHDDMKLMDFDYLTFHQPSGYMPVKTCKMLAQEKIEILDNPDLHDRIRLTPEFIEERVKPWLRVLDTGNTYAASTPIAISDILDHAKPGENLLAVSYGSGAYTIATWFRVEDPIETKRTSVPSVEQYINRRRDIALETYQDHIRQKLRYVKKRLVYPRLIGECEPLTRETIPVTLCTGCERIFYPARSRCLEFDCNGPVEQRSLPRLAKLVEFKRLPLRRRLTSNYELYTDGKVLLVDSRLNDLEVGMTLEPVIRRIDDEGKEGLILYGPCYRPLFRKAMMAMAVAA